MFAASVFLTFLLATQASYITTLMDSSMSTEEYFGFVSNVEKQIVNPASSRNGSRFGAGFYPLAHSQSTIDEINLFTESSDSRQSVGVSSDDVRTRPNMVSTPPGARPDSKAPYRAKIAIRKRWFIDPRHGTAGCASFESTSGIIQRVVGFGKYFRPHQWGLTTRGKLFGSSIEPNLMIFSEQLKDGQVVVGKKALKDQGLFRSKGLLKVEKSANDTLAVVLAGERIVFHSFGAPPFAAVLLRVKNGQYEPIMVNEDNMSVEGTLKSKDIIVVGVCETIWRGLSFPAGKSLEDIATNIARQLPYGMAVAAIIR
ncbi:hypothetical protein PSACC_00585 [Paramicrosporidium saccamoebae]|uniref:Uncharacterized protein n=1 Tax=Paramicrosporidium saccamoebae TaxID=1246581 RepID=A0A2H9TPC1_9FUNG|nr:hypothetical protein PSACC_00585 [Paramicrosporidium saccamoebae]